MDASTPPVWEMVNDERDTGSGGYADCYTDYEHYVPDVNGVGVKLRVSICTDGDKRTATLSVLADSDTGEFGEASMPLPLVAALAMTGHN